MFRIVDIFIESKYFNDIHTSYIKMTTVNITIKCTNSDTATIAIDNTSLISELKIKIAEKLNIPANIQRLVYKGKVLKDEQTIEFYDIQDSHVVHLVRQVQSVAGQSSAAAPTTSPRVAGTSPLPNPFGAPASDPFGFGMGAPGMDMQQLMNNPDYIQSMLNSPMMDSLLNNPELMSSMIMQNPQIQAMLDANPQMRHVFSDPAMIRQSMEMMRNPRMMQETMRQNDVAMSQIENHPEGYNALTRMYEQMDAAQSTTAAPATPNPSWSNPASPAPTAPNTAALPNPWGARPTQPAATGLGGFGGFGQAGAGGFNPFLGGMGGAGGFGQGAAGAGGLPGMGGMDPNQIMSMLQDPMMQQTMQQMAANPQLLQQAIAMNPALARQMESNPATRAMLQNPEQLRQMFDPANLQAMIQMQQSMQQLQSAGIMPPVPSPFGAGFGAPAAGAGPSAGGLDFSQLLGRMNLGVGGGFPPPTLAAVQPPEVRFATQLQQLQEMGFVDSSANITALTATSGNVQAAVERLLGGN